MVHFEYNHFAFLGPESLQAAAASECANEQGQFWPYHDILFANQQGENQGAFNDDALKAFAAALGLDETAFDQCLASGRYEEEVQSETAAGQARGVTSTPTLFINGEKVEGAIPFAQLQSRIEAILAADGSGG
jgi:protein-disulfide isomerase